MTLARAFYALMGDVPDSEVPMTDPTVTEPILVNAKAGPDQWAAGIRYGLMLLSGIAISCHWSRLGGELSDAATIAGLVAAPAIGLMGQIKTRQQSLKLTVLAKAAPDNVAQVKGEPILPQSNPKEPVP